MTAFAMKLSAAKSVSVEKKDFRARYFLMGVLVVELRWFERRDVLMFGRIPRIFGPCQRMGYGKIVDLMNMVESR